MSSLELLLLHIYFLSSLLFEMLLLEPNFMIFPKHDSVCCGVGRCNYFDVDAEKVSEDDLEGNIF